MSEPSRASVHLRLPGGLHEALASLAATEHRSLNGQILFILETACSQTARTVPAKRAARAAPAKPSARACRLPDDFAVTPAMAQWARDHVPGLVGAGRGLTETEKFRDHWRSASGSRAVKRDWIAAWRNWMRRADDDLSRGPQRTPARPGSQPAPEEWDQLRQYAREFDRSRKDGKDDAGRNGRPDAVHRRALPVAED